MKRCYAASGYAKPYERYCRERFPGEAERIFQRAEACYRDFAKETPDIGKNMMARNMLDWFTILHVEIVVIERHAREHRIDGHCAVAGFVAKLPYGAFLALRQQKRARLKHAQIVWHCRHLLQTVNLN